MHLHRLLYLGYYFRELDWRLLDKFMTHASRQYCKPKRALWVDLIGSSLKYNISILEYFNFRFYEIPEQVRKSFAGTGFMYEYQLAMNPKTARSVLENKLEFLKAYAPFIRHDYASLAELDRDPAVARRILANSSGKVVLKSSFGQCGRGIEVRLGSDFTPESLVRRLRETGNDFVEEFVVQHRDLMRLSPSGLNTVRVITQLNKAAEVDILGARLRITVNSSVDNLAAGNIAAPINLDTGIVEGPGVYSDITKADEAVHPVTGVAIAGFQVPFWREALEMVTGAALTDIRNRSIGWDVAITDQGPELIEGNHDWCKLLWQLPVKQGLKPILERYQNELRTA